MTISMYSASVPAFVRMLGNMEGWLEKAKSHATARNFDPAVYLTMRLAPDMLPLPRQIQIASDGVKGCVARLAGVEIPKWVDDETSLEELSERLRRTRDFVLSIPAEAFEGSATRSIEVPRRDKPAFQFSGEDYLRHFVLPNFYFHATTSYALLRHAGVPLGKMDYLGG